MTCPRATEHPRCARSRVDLAAMSGAACRNIRAARGAEFKNAEKTGEGFGTSALRAEPRRVTQPPAQGLPEHPRCARSREHDMASRLAV